jgi:hypothetical protein
MLESLTKRAALSLPRAGATDSYHTPTLTRLLLHAYSYTPALTRLLVHAYSYTPTLTPLGAQLTAARLPRVETTESHD